MATGNTGAYQRWVGHNLVHSQVRLSVLALLTLDGDLIDVRYPCSEHENSTCREIICDVFDA